MRLKPRSPGRLLSTRILVLGGLLAWASALPAVPPDAPKTKPDRVSTYISKPENDIYFLQRNGDEMLFNSRPYQPGSSWQTTPTAIYVVDAKTTKVVRKIPTDYTIEFNIQPQGRIAALQERGAFRIYDLQDGRVVQEFPTDAANPHYWVKWSPDGKKFTFEGEYPTVLKMFDLETREIRTLRQNRFVQIYDNHWSADSKSLMFLETPINPFVTSSRKIQVMDVDPRSSGFGKVTQQFAVERKHMTGIQQVTWKEPGLVVAWQREGGYEGLYREVILEYPSGKTLGHGWAKDESVDDTDEPWTYTSLASGKTGTFVEVFGRKHPDRNEPLPLSPGQAREHWSAQHRRLTDDLILWTGHRGGFKYRVTDRQGHLKLEYSGDLYGHVDVQGKTVRAFLSTGELHEYDL